MKLKLTNIRIHLQFFSIIVRSGIRIESLINADPACQIWFHEEVNWVFMEILHLCINTKHLTFLFVSNLCPISTWSLEDILGNICTEVSNEHLHLCYSSKRLKQILISSCSFSQLSSSNQPYKLSGTDGVGWTNFPFPSEFWYNEVNNLELNQ